MIQQPVEIPSDLAARWNAAWTGCADASAAPEGALRGLLVRYGEPHRAYHNLEHIRECLALLDDARHELEHPACVELAVWYHDAVYKPSRSDNESASAALAVRDLADAGVSPAIGERVAALVMDTAHRTPPASRDGAVLVDIDLAILGASPSRFARYERAIRREYRWVPGPIYRRRRVAVLRAFLARDPLFTTSTLWQRFEAAARRNLADSIAQLSGR